LTDDQKFIAESQENLGVVAEHIIVIGVRQIKLYFIDELVLANESNKENATVSVF